MWYSELEIILDPTGTPTTLLSWGDLLNFLPTVNGAQLLQTEPLIRADSPFLAARKNRTNTIRLSIARPRNNTRFALDRAFVNAQYPDALLPVRFRVEGGGTYTATQAIVTDWSSVPDGRVENIDLTLVTNAITTTTAPPADT